METITPWDVAINFVLRMEGGYTVDPKDPGGETNFGISHKAYPAVDIKGLTVEKAKAIYFKDYWQACQCDQMAAPFALLVFDTAVNQGESVAARLLQVALGLKVDAFIGPKTVAATHRADGDAVMKFLYERLAAYARLMATHQNLLLYASNWSHRVLALAQTIWEKPFYA